MNNKKYILFTFLTVLAGAFQPLFAQQKGYYDAPYTRYEANLGTLTGASATTSYSQADIAFEASDRTAVNLRNGNSVEWNITGNFNRLGIVIRYSVAGVINHTDNKTANVQLYVGGELKETLTLNTYYSWEMLKDNGDVNNSTSMTDSWRFRFDEVRRRIDQNYPNGTTVKLVSQSNDLWIDFIEVESVPEPKTAVQQGADASFTGGDLQAFINSNQGKTIYLAQGTYNIGTTLEPKNTKLAGAGMWYTEIYFSSKMSLQGGIHFTQSGQNVKDLSLSTYNNSRHSDNSNSSGYKGFWGSTSNATIENVWAEHFECGAWMAGYSGEGVTSNVTFRYCRFRNNYADGINFCKGANNNLAEHCDFRNNGDDDMAVWPANNQQCYNNTFQYNTAELCWRASSCALYGGYGNRWQNIIVKDNYEVGIRMNGIFGGSCFADGTPNEFSNIDVIGCGTPYNTYGNPDPAVDITTASNCSDLRNINFSCINILNSKFDAVYFRKEGSGNQIRNISMNGITINGTNRYGQNQNSTWGNAAGIRFINTPNISNVSFCGTMANIQGTQIVSAPASGWTYTASGCTSCGSTVVDVASVTISPKQQTIIVGGQIVFSTTILPSNATNPQVNYTIQSGNGVLNNNILTANAAGTIVVRAAAASNAAIYDEATITVNQPSAVGNIEDSGIKIISNNGNIEIQGIEIGEKVLVYNILGIKIYSQTATQNPMFINNLKSGVYILFFENKNISTKIIVSP